MQSPPGENQLPRISASLAIAIQGLLSRPSQVVAIFWGGGVIAALSVLPLQDWSPHSQLTLLGVGGLAALGCGVRITAGARLPRWTLQVDVGIATVLVSVLAAIGDAGHVGFAHLYVWVAVFAALYFRPLAALAWLGAIAAAWAGVLVLGPRIADPVANWLSVVGTVTVAGAVILGLVCVLRNSARADPLTGLANRRWWDERLGEELGRAQRTGAPLSLAIIDLDSFKAVNDQRGHAAGDRLLQQLARAWQGVAHRSGDFMARLGGDEFGVLAPGSDHRGVQRLVARLKERLPEGVSFSVGVVSWDGAEGEGHLVRRADQAMYRMKRRSRLSA